MAEEIEWFVGIDWASQSHQVCLVDARGECLGERAVAHGGLGIEELCDWLVPHRRHARGNWGGNRNDAGPLDLALGIERGEIGILEDIAVDRQRDALLDLADESAAAPRRAA